MAGKRVLARLLRLRELEEELSRLDLELAVAERNRVQQEMNLARSRQVQGRATFVIGVEERDTGGRAEGAFEMEMAKRQQGKIEPRLELAEGEVARQREIFLERCTGRQQVDTLVSNQRTLAEIEVGRRAQQMLDDWYGRRGRREA